MNTSTHTHLPPLRRRPSALLAVAAAFSLASAASAATIGLQFLNFGADVGQTNMNHLFPTDSAGVPEFAQVNWNNYVGALGTNAPAQDSSGAATAVTVSWACPNTYRLAADATGTGSPDVNLMNSYLDNNGNANVAITSPYNMFDTAVPVNNNRNWPLIYLTGLGAWMASQGVVAYDLVIYSDGDATSARVGEYWAVDATGTPAALTVGPDVTTHVFISDIQNFTANQVYAGVPLFVQDNALPGMSGLHLAQYGHFPGNYTVLRSLTNHSVLLRTQRSNTRAPINAVQIIPRDTILPATIYGMFDAKVYAGGKARFYPVVGGGAPLTYQWLKNGTPLADGGNVSGATTAKLTLSNVTGSDAAAYSLVVSNPLGVVTSSPAQLTVVTPAANSYAQKVATDSPYAYWRFNETEDTSSGFAPAYDAFGGLTAFYGMAAQNGAVGVVGPAPSEWPGFEAGNLAYASSRPGARWVAGAAPATAYLIAPPLLLNTNTATFTAWIYPTAAQGGFTGLIFTRGADVAGFGYGNNNMLGYTWNSNNAATYNFVSSLVPRTNEWNFVALTISPSNAVIYCYNAAGQLSATNSITHSNQFWGGPTFIGVDPSSITAPQGRGFVGSIDEVAIFNRTLSEAEIYSYYKKGLGLTAIGPTFMNQPQSLALFEGRTAKFTVSVSGDAPLAYRWRRNGVPLTDGGNILGAETPSLTLSGVSIAADAGTYDVVVGNIVGSVPSSPATLTVVASNSTPTAYEAALRAANPIAYWRLNEPGSSGFAYDYWGGNIAAHNASVVTGVDGPQSPDFVGLEANNAAAAYDGFGAGTSTSVSLMNNRSQFSVIGWFNAPSQLQQNRAGLFGQNDVCEFGFHGTSTLEAQQVGVWTPSGGAYLSVTNIMPDQWYLIAAVGNGSSVNLYLVSTNNGGTILQATGTASTTNYGSSLHPFRIGGDGILDAAGNFFTGKIDEVAVFDRALTSDELAGLLGIALVGGDLPPVISIQPAEATTLYAGRTFTLTTTVVGKNLHYQWRKDGLPISDAGSISGTATNVLVITGVTAADAGAYDLVVTNSAGAVTSHLASLTVIQPTPGGFEAMVIAANPLAYYRFGETDDPSLGGVVAHDYVGGFNGTFGAAAQNGFNSIAGPLPPDWKFETTNTALRTTVSTADSWVSTAFGSLSTNTVTFAMWIYPIGLQESWCGLLMSRGGTAAGGFGYNDQQMLAYTWNANSSLTYGFVSGLVPPTNQWSFVAMVIEPTQATLYLCNANGIQTAVNTLAHTSDVFGAWQIGHDNNGNNATRAFNGVIDEVAVYRRSLSRSEIEGMYAAGGGLVPVAPTLLSLQKSGDQIVLSWPQGTLLQADEITGPWTTNAVTSPYTLTPSETRKFYRVIQK